MQASNGRMGHSMSSDTTMQDDIGSGATKNVDTAKNASNASLAIESLINPTSKSLMPVGSGSTTHAEPKKELAESVKHGTSVFPFAAYIWDPQPFTSRVPLHWHRELELVRFSGAEYEISVDMHNVVVKDDAFLLLPGNIMHTFTLPANCQESAIVFDPRMLAFSSYDEVQSEILEPLLSSKIPLPPIITTEHPAFNRIDKLYRYCVRNGGTTNASQRLLIKAKLLEILAIYHEYGLLSRKDVHTHKTSTKQDKLKELLNYVDSHYAGPITIRDASLRLGVTDQYFCRYFRRVTGMSFTEYLNDLRLRRATKEIELTNRSISDIAFDHGFENAGYFFKNFKQKYGITPLRYRKKYLKENAAYTINTIGSHGGTHNPIDADHTSAIHESDMNTLSTKAADNSKSNRKFTSQGLIQARDSECDVEEYYLNSIVSPYINADDEVDAVTANRAAEATAAAIAKANAAAAAKGQTLSDEDIAAAASSVTGEVLFTSKFNIGNLKHQNAHRSAASAKSKSAGKSSATATTSAAAHMASSAANDAVGNKISPSSNATSSKAALKAASLAHGKAMDDDVEYYEDEYESPIDEDTSAFIKDKVSNHESVDNSIFKVATTEEEIKSLLKTGRIKHLESSESEDELFDDDEDDFYISPTESQIVQELSTLDDTLEPRPTVTRIKSPLQELAESHTRGSTAASRKAKVRSTLKSDDEYDYDHDGSHLSEDDALKKKNFVSALEEYQNQRTLRNSQRNKSSAKSPNKNTKSSSKGANSTSSSRHGSSRVYKHTHASQHMIDPNTLPNEDRSLTGLSTFDNKIRQTRDDPVARAIQQNQSRALESSKQGRKYALGSSFEDDEIESSSEILRRAMENKIKSDSSFAAEKQQKSDKPVNRAELRAKIAELEARNKNDDPFSI